MNSRSPSANSHCGGMTQVDCTEQRQHLEDRIAWKNRWENAEKTMKKWWLNSGKWWLNSGKWWSNCLTITEISHFESGDLTIKGMEVMFHMKTVTQEAELTMNMTKNGADLQYLPWTRGFVRILPWLSWTIRELTMKKHLISPRWTDRGLWGSKPQVFGSIDLAWLDFLTTSPAGWPQ